MRISIKHPEMFAAVFEEVTKIKLNRPINGIATDSREIQENDLYIAIKGENVDGHKFIRQSEILGANAALVQMPVSDIDIQQIRVKDTIEELGKISAEWRNKFDIPVIGITGSNGKTSTKELLAHVLSENFHVHATKGNFNTYIGLPLTLLEIEQSHDISILEMGASVPGEIKKLCEIANPTHGLITNIAPAHLEGFGSIETIAHEKGALFRSLTNGLSFVNKTDNLISNLNFKGKQISFGLNPNCDFPADIFHEDDGTLTLILDTNVINTESRNLSFIKNCIAVSAISINLGVSWDILENRIQSFTSPKGRCFVKQIKDITIIDDTYNANLTSSLAALDYLKAFSGNGRCIFVFGDMYELGEESDRQHRNIGEKCLELGLDKVYTIGTHTKHTGYVLDKNIKHEHFKTKENLILSLKSNMHAGDKILFKGSRGMAMEEVIKGVFES